MDKAPNKTLMSVILVLVVIGIGYLVTKPKTSETIKIGAVLGLTGDGAYWGENTKTGLTMAVDDINQSGGIKGRNLEIIYEDSKCDSKNAVNAIQKLIDIDKIKVVVGDICSSPTLAMAPIAEAKKILLMTPCSESAAISQAGDYVFRTWTPNNRQASIVAKYAFAKLDLKRVAVLRLNNDFGNSLADVFVQTFKEQGGMIVADEKYAQDSRDFRTQLTKIKAAQPEAVYLSSYQPDGLAAIKQLRALGIQAKILATSGINSVDDFFKPLGTLAEGIILADLKDSTTQEFKNRYEKTYQKEWPGVGSCVGVAYDGLRLISRGIEKTGLDATKIKNYFYSVKDFPGVSGPITFDANGDLDREHAVFVVTNGRPKFTD